MRVKVSAKFMKDEDNEWLAKGGFDYHPSTNTWERIIWPMMNAKGIAKSLDQRMLNYELEQ